MSSAASRKRQRQHRRAREKLWAAQKDLADRTIDLEAYERVLADMTKRQLSPFSGSTAFAIVRVCRDAAARDHAHAATVVAALKKSVPQ